MHIIKAAEKSADERSQILALGPTQDNAAEAVSRAEELFAWTMKHLPSFGDGDESGQATVLSKQEKLIAMPYTVAMAFAVRVKTDAHMVQSHSTVNPKDRQRILDKSCKDVKSFIEQLQKLLMATVRDTSLLELALDYHLPMTTYIMLIDSMRASVELMKDRGNTTLDNELQALNDELSKIR